MPKLTIEYDGKEPIARIQCTIEFDPLAGIEAAADKLNNDADQITDALKERIH